jgi:hypothetical protein
MPTPHDRPPAQRDPNPVIEWFGYHLVELTGVGTPTVLSVTVSSWWAWLSVLAAAWWAAHEWRLHRRKRARRAITAAQDPQPEHITTDQATA